MKTIYKDSKHFDEETFIQAKFFKMPVNAYRKGVAIRHGYKSSKLFKEFLDKTNKEASDFSVKIQEVGNFPLKTKNRVFKNRDIAMEYFESQKNEALSKSNIQIIYQDNFDEICYPFTKDAWKNKVAVNTPLKQNIFTFCVELKADYVNADEVIKTLDGHILSKKEIDGFQTDFTFKLNYEITESDLKNKIKDIVLSNKKMCDMKYFFLTVKSGFVSQDDFVY